MRIFQRTPWNLESHYGNNFGISQTKQIRMPKLQEHHSKGPQWCKINIDLFNFF